MKPTRLLSYATAALAALALLGGGVPAGAQSAAFPPDAPSPVFTDDFSAGAGNWVDIGNGAWNTISTDPPWCFASGHWDQYLLASVGTGGEEQRSVAVISQSLPGHIAFEPAQWTNVRLEFDFVGAPDSILGAVWGLEPDDAVNPDGEPDAYYAFVLSDLAETEGDDPATWTLIRRENDANAVIGTGSIHLPELDSEIPTLRAWRCYRLRVDFFCGNLRVSVRRETFGSSWCQSGCYDGCGAGCSDASPEDCWCTLVEWSDAGAWLTPGGVGLVGAMATNEWWMYNAFDNVEVSSWGPECSICGPWLGWTETNRDTIAMKHLYQAALWELRLNAPGGEVNVHALEPAITGGRNTSGDGFCNGMRLFQDLPPPGNESDTQDKLLKFLEPMATAVDLTPEAGAADWRYFSWLDLYDESDPDAAGYNPRPIPTRGTTPIADALWDAWEWYSDHRSSGGLWADDEFAECREWYVVLITDGEESCKGAADYVCQPGEAPSMFADPPNPLLDPVEVYTIGFSQDVGDDSPLVCVADQTGGEFYTSANASELSSILYQVFSDISGGTRSFVPVKISPPPSTRGAGGSTQDYLVVYPTFAPQQGFSIWDGNLHTYRVNEATPTVPATLDADGNCVVDSSYRLWDAQSALQSQLDSGHGRNVYMARDTGTAWARNRLEAVGSDSTIRAYFVDKLDVSAGVSDTEIQEVVNFVRNIRTNEIGASPAPQDPPRPDGTSILGDFFHSQPVIVSPPNNYRYMFGGATGVNGYLDFVEKHGKRRRFAVAGANDGQLHFFDAGFFDRQTSGPYVGMHDLGTGQELAAWVPNAVMDTLHTMTYQNQHQYTVDGMITVADAFFDTGGGSDEWRTVLVASLRRGGRGVVALDVTQPDRVGGSPGYDVTSGTNDFPSCLDGTNVQCDGAWPAPLWEFTEGDTNGNCPTGLTGSECEPWWDLGQTWSKPVVARLPVYTGASTPPDDAFVVFFGGGWDPFAAYECSIDSDGDGVNDSGCQWVYNSAHFFYGVDVATGNILAKITEGSAVPGEPVAVDANRDGYTDLIYYATSDGKIVRLRFPGPTDATANGASSYTRTVIYDFSADDVYDESTYGATDADGHPIDPVGRQQFFTRPVPVVTGFTGSGYSYGLAIGSGDRAELDEEDGIANRFYFVLDKGQSTAIGSSSLTAVSVADIASDADCQSAIDEPGEYGWYLQLRPGEKVNTDASVRDGWIRFASFEAGIFASVSPPNPACGGGGGGGGGEGASPDGGDGGFFEDDDQPLCAASGRGRAYKLYYTCGALGEVTEGDHMITGFTVADIGSTRIYSTGDAGATAGQPKKERNEAEPIVGESVISNWRQE